MIRYLEFAVASNFSFLCGASHPEELIEQADYAGLTGIGLCDRNSVAGVVRAHVDKREKNLGLRYHPGARLVFADGTPDILAYPRNRAAWGRLTRLLTRGNLCADKGDCILYCNDLIEHIEGLELVVMEESSFPTPRIALSSPPPLRGRSAPAGRREGGKQQSPASISTPLPNPPPQGGREQTVHGERQKLLAQLRAAAPGRVRLAVSMLYRGNDRARLARRAAMACEARVPLIAVNDVHYHHPDRRQLADVFTCIREKVTIDRAGRKLAVNAERYLKPPHEMARLFRDAPEAIEETLALSDALSFSLDELKYEYPDEQVEGFASPQEALEYLSWKGAAERYPGGIDDATRQSLAHEFALIAKRKYAPYFLTVYDIVRYARSKNILCQGRGSAANSTVCYCLGITAVDPVRGGLLFERFISGERDEPPDIDVDFEHERREEVIQYIYKKYGRERAGIAATVICYRGRSAIREVGKAFGLSDDTIGALTSSIWGGGGGAVSKDAITRAGLDIDSPRMRQITALAKEINGFPRHLSQHVGGFVITRSRLDEVVPIANAAMDDRTFVEWDKNDLDALNILKVDVLGLGMLTCIRKALELLESRYGERHTLASIPEENAVYRMLGRADSLGVFQVESRAQMSMLPRLQPRTFYDLVIEVAIVRPGPIQGDMVHPYLRRRQGLEPENYPSEELKAVLSKTLGVPLFQEQAMKIAIIAGGFTPSEADKLRRAMATFKRTGTIGTFRDKMVGGMVAKGYPREFAERCFGQIEGFGEYGFPESHAASFALLVYASAWLKCRYPDVFAAALLNAQPMGFYASAQIVRDVREHGVEVRPPDINHSFYDATLESGPAAAERIHPTHREMAGDIRATHAIRLGLREIKGLSEEDAQLIVERRICPGRSAAPLRAAPRSGHQSSTPYDSLRDLWLRTELPSPVLERLADADTFGSLGLSRRDALWAVKALGRTGDHEDLPLFRAITSNRQEPDVTLTPMPLGEQVVNDYRFLKLSLRAHPSSFLRADLTRRKIIKNELLRQTQNGARVCISGLITVRQRPGTAKGVIFMTIEDETAIANVIVWPKIFERFRTVVLGARYVAVTGPMQTESGVIHVVAEHIEDLTPMLAQLADGGTADDLDVQARATRHAVAKTRGRREEKSSP